jgi:PAS domain S-box-containing protein
LPLAQFQQRSSGAITVRGTYRGAHYPRHTGGMPDPNPLTTALLAAMMHSRQPMVLTDPNLPDHPMIAVNPAFTGMTGYPESETVGRNCRFLQGSGTDRAATSRLHACIAERRGCVEWVLNHRKSGEAFWNLLFISPVFSRDGTLLHYFGNQRDITHGSSDAEAGDHHVLGKADMAAPAEAEFHALLLGLLNTQPDPARHLETLVEAGRRLNSLTLRLSPAPWSPPSLG